MKVRHTSTRILSLILSMILVLTGCGGNARRGQSEGTAEESGTTGGGAGELGDDELTAEPAVHFSNTSGIYETHSLRIVMTAPAGYTICYTTDGSAPTIEDDTGEGSVEIILQNTEQGYLVSHRDEMIIPEYTDSYLLENDELPLGTMLFAALADEEGNLSSLTGHVYFLGENPYRRYPDTLILSIIVNPDYLLNYETGILATGRIYDEWKTQPDAADILARGEYYYVDTNSQQRGKDWERECLIQIYDGDLDPTVTEAAGMRVTGGVSRTFSQKSFNIYMRDEYGSKKLEYELFEGVSELKSFRIRAGGNNTERLKFKDAFLMELAEGRAVDRAKTSKAVLFINGEYWGPYILSERVTAQMLSVPYGLDKDQVIVIKEAEVEDGEDEDIRLYEELMSYAEKDLTDPAIYSELSEILNMQSFADYCAIRVYIGDDDWHYNKNELLWRTRDDSYDGGRWHFILYDLENSAGMYGYERTAPETDHFTLAMERHPLFGALIQNHEFYEMFLEAIKEIGSENYSAERAGSLLDAYLEEWEPLMADCYLRYGDHHYWTVCAQYTRDFFERRYEFIIPIVEAYGR